MIVPDTVTAGPPADMVVPAMEKAKGFGVNVWPGTVNGEIGGNAGDGVGSEIIVPSIASAPDGPRLMILPVTVTAGPPAEIVVPAVEKAEGLWVKVWPATIDALTALGIDDGVGSKIVVLPKTSSPE